MSNVLLKIYISSTTIKISNFKSRLFIKYRIMFPIILDTFNFLKRKKKPYI